MKIAVIDLGTNTFNLLITEMVPGRVIPEILEKSPVKLGLGFENNRINQDTLDRAYNCLKDYKQLILQNNVKKSIAFGTSALRSADNGIIFVNQIQEELGLAINIIDGDMEADLIYEGVKRSGILRKEASLIMDIGGGSTEYIIGNDEQIFWKKSFPLGVSRLKNKFVPSDPMLQNEITDVTEHVISVQHELYELLKKYKVNVLIGSSGSFDSFGELLFHHFNGLDIGDKPYIDLDKENLKTLTEQLLQLTYKERLNLKGLVQMRAELIPLSSILLNAILDAAEIKTVQLCTHALKEGALNMIDNDKFAVTQH
ncbi:MAG: hypothetical protein MRY83_01255 [Flavobacteriales bacterium]|nr:hypothetical protein [Flavobacteriales bacterium]